MQVCELRLNEVVHLDTCCLDEICRRFGQIDSETEICATMEDLAELIYKAEKLWAAGDPAALSSSVRQMAILAKRLGMTALVRVARDVENLCRQFDSIALGATVARLRRLGEQSLLAIWDVQDQMM